MNLQPSRYEQMESELPSESLLQPRIFPAGSEERMMLRWLFSCRPAVGANHAAVRPTRRFGSEPGGDITVGHLVEANVPSETAPKRELPYRPQPGDIVVYDDFNRFFHFIFQFADTAPPTHAAMVIAGPTANPPCSS